MKTPLTIVAAAALLVAGAAADHALTAGSGRPAAVSPTSTQATTDSSPTSQTTLLSNTGASDSASAIQQATQSAYQSVIPSVVYVNNVGIGTGSGVVYDTKGDIVTNYHVVSGGTTIKVSLNDGRTFKATVLGTDPADDLAVIHINASNLHPATFATGSQISVAEPVLAVGEPLGLKGSVSFGLISGLDRVEQEPNGAYLPNAIQTSAPINPGNSGGALATLSGLVVGMPTLEQTSTNTGEATQGIGFAIPSTRITYIANQIIATGKVENTGRAYLGIAPTDPSQQGYGGGFGPFGGPFGGGTTPNVEGAVVSQVAPSGPAGRAGVQQGDVITKVNGRQISSAQDLLTILANARPGQTLTLRINRNGRALTVHVKLGELPA